MLSKTEYGIYSECVNNPNSMAYNLPVFLKLDKKSFIYPSDLLNERLYHITIVKLTTSVVLFLDVHHIIFDGTSLPILLRDIDKAYS